MLVNSVPTISTNTRSRNSKRKTSNKNAQSQSEAGRNVTCHLCTFVEQLPTCFSMFQDIRIGAFKQQILYSLLVHPFCFYFPEWNFLSLFLLTKIIDNRLSYFFNYVKLEWSKFNLELELEWIIQQ